MKPLISYYGGKQRIASRIVEILNQIPHTVYVEPFFGGGAVFFARPHIQPGNDDHYREVINDSSELLINLYRVAREQQLEFQRIIDWTPYSRSDHALALSICKCKDKNKWSSLDRAWAYYVNISMSFSKRLNAGWGVGLYGPNSAAIWHNRKRHIAPVLERLEKVHIECRDALRVIEQWDSPQTLVYCDPPYPEADQGHYEGYTLENWQQLCDVLDKAQCSYVLSNYPQDIEPQSAQKRIEINATMSASCKGRIGIDRSQESDYEELGDRSRTEVLWVCDRSSNMRESLKPALEDVARSRTRTQLELLL